MSVTELIDRLAEILESDGDIEVKLALFNRKDGYYEIESVGPGWVDMLNYWGGHSGVSEFVAVIE